MKKPIKFLNDNGLASEDSNDQASIKSGHNVVKKEINGQKYATESSFERYKKLRKNRSNRKKVTSTKTKAQSMDEESCDERQEGKTLKTILFEVRDEIKEANKKADQELVAMKEALDAINVKKLEAAMATISQEKKLEMFESDDEDSILTKTAYYSFADDVTVLGPPSMLKRSTTAASLQEINSAESDHDIIADIKWLFGDVVTISDAPDSSVGTENNQDSRTRNLVRTISPPSMPGDRGITTKTTTDLVQEYLEDFDDDTVYRLNVTFSDDDETTSLSDYNAFCHFCSNLYVSMEGFLVKAFGPCYNTISSKYSANKRSKTQSTLDKSASYTSSKPVIDPELSLLKEESIKSLIGTERAPNDAEDHLKDEHEMVDEIEQESLDTSELVIVGLSSSQPVNDPVVFPLKESIKSASGTKLVSKDSNDNLKDKNETEDQIEQEVNKTQNNVTKKKKNVMKSIARQFYSKAKEKKDEGDSNSTFSQTNSTFSQTSKESSDSRETNLDTFDSMPNRDTTAINLQGNGLEESDDKFIINEINSKSFSDDSIESTGSKSFMSFVRSKDSSIGSFDFSF